MFKEGHEACPTSDIGSSRTKDSFTATKCDAVRGQHSCGPPARGAINTATTTATTGVPMAKILQDVNVTATVVSIY